MGILRSNGYTRSDDYMLHANTSHPNHARVRGDPLLLPAPAAEPAIPTHCVPSTNYCNPG